MSKLVAPPLSALPPGASRWETVNNVAVEIQKKVRTVASWCEKGLLHSVCLAGGYGGVWVAVTAEGWPLDGPRVRAYREQRSEVARQRAAKLKEDDAAARELAPPPSSSRRSKVRRSA